MRDRIFGHRSVGVGALRKSVFACTFLALSAPLPVVAQEAMIVQADSLQWKAGPLALPNGAQFAAVVGDPTKEGPYVLRVKLPAGFKIAPHYHPNDENLTVISGTFNLGTGETFDEGKAQPIKAGGYAHIPKTQKHFGWASEDTIFQLHSIGPSTFNYINPTDDPRKK